MNTPDYNWKPGAEPAPASDKRELVEVKYGALAGYGTKIQLKAGPGFRLERARIQPLEKADHATLVRSWNADSLARGRQMYSQLCVTCHGTLEKEGSLPTALRFHEGQFRNGKDPYRMFQTLEQGYGLMVPQPQYNTAQKYDIIHYLRETFLKELVWREFAHHVTFHQPDMATVPMDAKFRDFPWEPDDDLLAVWQQGRTGYPMVDAGMRELWATGTMHNRVRMVAASFLVKHLLQPWQAGESWFWDTLVDADPAQRFESAQFFVAGKQPEPAPPGGNAAEHAEHDVGHQRQPVDQIELLKDHADAAAYQAHAAGHPPAFLDRISEHLDHPVARLVGQHEAGDMAHQSRFPRTGCADQRHHFTGHDLQTDLVQGPGRLKALAKGLRKIVYADSRCGVGRHRHAYHWGHPLRAVGYLFGKRQTGATGLGIGPCRSGCRKAGADIRTGRASYLREAR